MNRIKESFDSLPIAVCFFDSRGVVRLVNSRMLRIFGALRNNGVQTLAELRAALDSPPDGVCCLDRELGMYRFPDGAAHRFSQEGIRTDSGHSYVQLTAADVTEIAARQEQLAYENARLTDANRRARLLLEQMPELIREEETLAMKLRVHDDFGHAILSSRRALADGATLEGIRDSARAWARVVSALYRASRSAEPTDAVESALSRVNELGVRLVTEGALPRQQAQRALLAAALRECAANCARHAGATELYVRIESIGSTVSAEITNNGAPPEATVAEGGGLSMLRRRIEAAGGTMQILSRPRFMLALWLPDGGEA